MISFSQYPRTKQIHSFFLPAILAKDVTDQLKKERIPFQYIYHRDAQLKRMPDTVQAWRDTFEKIPGCPSTGAMACIQLNIRPEDMLTETRKFFGPDKDASLIRPEEPLPKDDLTGIRIGERQA